MKFLLSIILFLAIVAEVVLLQWCAHLEKRIDLVDLSGPRIYLLPAPAVSPAPSLAVSPIPASVVSSKAPVASRAPAHQVKKLQPLPQKKEELPKPTKPVSSSPVPLIPLVESPTITSASAPGKECTNPFGCYLPFRPFSQF